MHSSKLKRFLTSIHGVTPGRCGSCIPDKCETLTGEKGGACCKISGRCLMLKNDSSCAIYNIRPGNCIIFPRTPQDLALVKNCGYYWQDTKKAT